MHRGRAVRKRLWHHVTDVYRGEILVAERRPPVLRTESEPLTPCVCVPPRRSWVWDVGITGERWLVPPVALELRSVVPAAVVRDVTAAWLRVEQGRRTTFKTRIA